MSKQCKAKTKRGDRCPNPAGESDFCFVHDPARSAERTAARKLGGYHRAIPRVSGAEPIEIKAVADVVRLANAVIRDCWAQENTSQSARAILAAGDLALRALTIGDLEARLAALERAAAQRTGNGNA